jgi:hypothetical protein
VKDRVVLCPPEGREVHLARHLLDGTVMPLCEAPFSESWTVGRLCKQPAGVSVCRECLREAVREHGFRFATVEVEE